LSDAIITAVAQLVDDAQEEGYREPSHSDLQFLVSRAGLDQGDPKTHGQSVGKAKRVRAVCNWALTHRPAAGEEFVAALIGTLQGLGGFRAESSNYVGKQAIRNAVDAFRSEGYSLGTDGDLRPLVLGNLRGAELTDALMSYVRRAQRGSLDAALLAGTGKDLLEATAAHVLDVKWGTVPQTNFPGLLGQAFVALGMATPQDPAKAAEKPVMSFERALYQLGCGVNTLRNKGGTGHGRPFLPDVSTADARDAVEAMGLIAGFMLRRLSS
jgi:hypothetical protein